MIKSEIINSLLNKEFKEHIEPIYFDKFVSYEESIVGFERLLHSKNFRYIMDSDRVEVN